VVLEEVIRVKPISYKRHRFPPEVIRHAVWLYFRFALSLRDVEDLLAERGIEVSYETVGAGRENLGRHSPAICAAPDRGRPRHGIWTRWS
jgi:transposase-like protein